MATTAQCIFCFEVLTSELEKRKRLSLTQCEELWAKYQARLNPEKEAKPEPEDDEDQDEDDSSERAETARSSQPLQPDGVSRLQAESPASGSGKSTPSSTSSDSSAATLLSAASKASSKSSLFSFARKAATKTAEYPVFVTWDEMNSRGGKSLRGCVGTFEAAPLAHNLETYSITSAFNDHRFSPITASELPRLRCSLTLLTNFTPCDSPLDWTLGTHGLRISFTHHGQRYGATYLPDVAPEQRWTKEETVISLMRKAGWSGRDRDWTRVTNLAAIRYEGDKASVGWAEYKDWRAWLRAENLD